MSAPSPTAKRPRRRGVLLIVALLFLGSATIRVGVATAEVAARQPAEDPAPDAQTCSPEPEISAILAALTERERQVGEREAQVEARLADLASAEAALKGQMAGIEAASAALSARLAQAESASEDDLGQLTAVYEAMKPADASKLFQEMAPEFAAGFLGRMRPDAAAAIMAGLEPATAYSISIVLAGRHASLGDSQAAAAGGKSE